MIVPLSPVWVVEHILTPGPLNYVMWHRAIRQTYGLSEFTGDKTVGDGDWEDWFVDQNPILLLDPNAYILFQRD